MRGSFNIQEIQTLENPLTYRRFERARAELCFQLCPAFSCINLGIYCIYCILHISRYFKGERVGQGGGTLTDNKWVENYRKRWEE